MLYNYVFFCLFTISLLTLERKYTQKWLMIPLQTAVKDKLSILRHAGFTFLRKAQLGATTAVTTAVSAAVSGPLFNSVPACLKNRPEKQCGMLLANI